MKAHTRILLAAAALALSPIAAQAQHHGGSHGGSGGSGWQGHAGSSSGGAHWGSSHWAGGHGYGGHWGYHGGWYARPSVGFYFGMPLFWGSWWDPYYYYPGAYYAGAPVVYREVITEPEPIEGVMQPPAAADAPAAPAAANPLSTNYCASAKAYFPQVKSCPEGWQHTSPTS